MFSESDEEEPYTVHRVKDTANAAPVVEVSPQHPPMEETKEEDQAATDGVSPLARYYRLGTEQRHAFDEHMRRLRSETQKSEREREFRQQHPFHPVRHTTAGDAERPKAQRTEETIAASLTTPSPVRPVFDRLAAQAVQLELRRRHREEQKRRAEAAALRDAFQPEINHRPPMHADPLHPAEDVPVEERLLHYGETVARERQRRQEKKAIEERAALAAAQAAVIGSTAGRPMDSVERRRLRMAFEERNERFVETRAQHRRQAEAEAAEAHSFQPQISATSAALDEARRRETEEVRRAELQALLRHKRSFGNASLSVDVQNTSGGREASRRSDALYAQAVARQRQQTEVRGRMGESSSDVAATTISTGEAAAAAHTHQPVTNPNSAKWIASGAHRHFFEQGFVQRQALYERVREEEASLKAAASVAAAAQQGEGAPLTNAMADGGGSVSSPRKAVTTKELNERLYYGARKAGEVAERRRAASLNARDCPFRPALAPGTNSVLQRMKSARDRDVVRRLTATTTSDGARHRAPLNPEKEGLYAASPSSRRTRSATTSLTNGGRRADSASSSTPSTTTGERVLEEAPAPAPAPAASPSPRRRVVVSRDQVEHFYQRQLTFLQERQDLIQERREGEAVQELVECTFRPRTNAEPASKPTSAGDEEAPSVNHVTGVSGFLERQKLARQRKAEHDELVRTMGLPRTKTSGSSSARLTTGQTLLSPFTLQTSQRRRRSSCSTAGAPQEEEGMVGEAAPVWRTALTSSERALYDALAETQQYPAVATGPLLPLPGYTPSTGDETAGEEDAVYFDDMDAYAADWASGAVEEAAAMPRPSTRQVRPTRRGEAAEGHGDRVSLFSSLSPNTFTGRSLSSRSPNIRGLEKDVRGGRHHGVNPSALKKMAAAAELTASAQRRRESRRVSFLVEGATPPPRVGHPTGNATAVPRADLMRHFTH